MKSNTASSTIYREAPEFKVDHLARHLLFRVRVRAGLTLLAFVLGVLLPPALFSESVGNLATAFADMLGGAPLPRLTEWWLALQPIGMGIAEWSRAWVVWPIVAAVAVAVFYLPWSPIRLFLFRMAFLASAPVLKLNLAVAAAALASALRHGNAITEAVGKAAACTPYPPVAQRLREWQDDLQEQRPPRRSSHRADEVMAPLRSLLEEANEHSGLIDSLDDLAELSWSHKDLATQPVATMIMLIIMFFTSGGLVWATLLPLIKLIQQLGG